MHQLKIILAVFFLTAGLTPALAQPVRNTSASNKTKQDKTLSVLFATNEDCDLFIDGEAKGTISKNDFRYIHLLAGSYTYKAVSKTTADEMVDSITVTTDGLNEVFLDMLWLIDQKNKQRELVKNQGENMPPLLATYGNRRDSDALQDGKKYLANIKEVMVNTILQSMVKIRGGEYVMGNNRSPLTDEIEHRVGLNSFYLSKNEVTVHQWESIMGYNPNFIKDCPDCAVSNVSWEEVIKFIRKLNAVSTKKFRLPTEAEWEYAAKFGGKAEIDAAGGQDEYIKKAAWYFSNAEAKIHQVGKKQPNAAGIYDMMGNVSEWCSDWYGPYYNKEEFNQVNPEGPPLGRDKVIRGGNFKDYIGDRFRPSLRNKKNPVEKGIEIGFRLAMDAQE